MPPKKEEKIKLPVGARNKEILSAACEDALKEDPEGFYKAFKEIVEEQFSEWPLAQKKYVKLLDEKKKKVEPKVDAWSKPPLEIYHDGKPLVAAAAEKPKPVELKKSKKKGHVKVVVEGEADAVGKALNALKNKK